MKVWAVHHVIDLEQNEVVALFQRHQAAVDHAHHLAIDQAGANGTPFQHPPRTTVTDEGRHLVAVSRDERFEVREWEVT